MMFPIITVEEWKARYNIKTPLRVKCMNCKKNMEFSVPVAYDNYRGLKTPEHGCSEEFDHYIDVSVDAEEINKLAQLMSVYKVKETTGIIF